METQIDTLIEKVKSHGIDEGKKIAEQIVDKAKSEAQQIVDEAKSEAQQIIARAGEEAKTLEQRGKDALKHAHRDLLLTVRADLENIFSSFIKNTSREALSSQFLKDVIIKALSQWKFQEKENIFISLSPEEAKNITSQAIEGALQASGGSINIVVDESVNKGFLLARESDGTGKFDFTDEAIGQSLIAFLTPVLKELLQ